MPLLESHSASARPAVGTLLANAAAIPDPSSCADISGWKLHGICTPTSYGTGFLLRPSWIPFAYGWVDHVGEFPRRTPVLVKLLLPPRQSRGGSQMTRVAKNFRREMENESPKFLWTF
jgi:hypothetical protein